MQGGCAITLAFSSGLGLSGPPVAGAGALKKTGGPGPPVHNCQEAPKQRTMGLGDH